jgi:hypothetical protein
MNLNRDAEPRERLECLRVEVRDRHGLERDLSAAAVHVRDLELRVDDVGSIWKIRSPPRTAPEPIPRGLTTKATFHQ